MKLSPVSVRQYRGIGKLEDTTDAPPGTLLGARNVQLAPVGGLMSPPTAYRLWGLGSLANELVRREIDLEGNYPVGAAYGDALVRFVRTLWTEQLWARMLGVYPLVGGTAETAAVDLMGAWPITWVDGDGLTFDGSGVTGDGTGYGNMGFRLLGNSNAADFGMTLAASGGGQDAFLMGALSEDASDYAGRALVQDADDSFVICTDTRTNTTVSTYIDGVLAAETTENFLPADEELMLGAVGFGGTGVEPATATLAFAAFHRGLTAEQVAILTAAVTQLLSELGRLP